MDVGTGGDSSAPHCLLTLRATLARCPIGLTARFACALTGPSTALPIYDLGNSAPLAQSSGADAKVVNEITDWNCKKSVRSYAMPSPRLRFHRPSSIVHGLPFSWDTHGLSEYLYRIRLTTNGYINIIISI